MTAAVAALVGRFWAGLDLPLQATLLCAFPLISLGGVELAARRERTLYVASLFALVAYGTFWLAIWVLSDTLNIPLSPPWIWGAVFFGVGLSLPYRFRLILAATLTTLIVALAGTVGFGLGTAFSAAGSTSTSDTGVTQQQRVASSDQSGSSGTLPGDVRQAEEKNAVKVTGIRRSQVRTP